MTSVQKIEVQALEILGDGLFRHERKNFEEILIEYFRPFWDAHQPSPGWMEENEDPILPIFHALVIGKREEGLGSVQQRMYSLIKKHFAAKISYIENGFHNNSGNFLFVDIFDEGRDLYSILRGRTYDIILILPPIAPTIDMIQTMLPHLKDNNVGRILYTPAFERLT